MRRAALLLVLLALLACSPPSAGKGEASHAAAPSSEQVQSATPRAEAAAEAPAEAKDAITAWARNRHGQSLLEPVSIFFGDFTGDGAADALAWVDFDTGGSSSDHDVALFRNVGGRMAFFRIDETVFGSEPGNVHFAQGRITLTTRMPKPDDPLCCPTGSRDWTINTN